MSQSFSSGPGQGLRGPRGLPYGTLTLIAVVGAIAIFALFNATTVVDAGTRGVVKTFGEVTGVFDEGLHFRAPFITEVVPVDVKTQRLTSESSAASRDLQIVTTQVVLNYRVDPDSVATLVREIGVDYEAKIIDPAIQESVKAATAQFTAENLITQRPLVSDSIRQVLNERLTPRGIIVEEVSITEFNFSEEFSRAIEAKQVAEQDALRAERELRRAQIEAQQQVARAEAEAEARLQIARAEAEALRLQREVISPELLQLRFIERWNGVLPRFMSGDTGLMPLINIPASELEETPAATNSPAPTTAPAGEPVNP
ncbi:MAG: prohibitin family protein [Oscillochloridaceae bacterium]|nr:prohibitin family protein [Chloroflexaceae bacterium]MDW8389305.1 prohibitin family protein [Oscillochloridaceae bacterium]